MYGLGRGILIGVTPGLARAVLKMIATVFDAAFMIVLTRI